MASLNAIGIVVSDLERSLAFYRLLGVAVPDTPGEGHVEATLANGARLMFDTEEIVKSFQPDWTRARGTSCRSRSSAARPAEVDETYARMTGAGFHGEKEPWDAFWGQRYAQLADPDGVPVDLYAAL